MRGRKRQPEAVREAKAPVRSKRSAAKVAQATPLTIGEVTPPAFRDVEAVKVWNALAPQLVGLRLLASPDVPAFARYCRLAARFEQVEKTLDDEGLTYESESSHGKLKRAHPAAMLSMRYSRELASLEASFGLNPADRQRIFAERARQGAGTPGDLFADRTPDTDTETADAPVAAEAFAEIPATGFLQ